MTNAPQSLLPISARIAVAAAVVACVAAAWMAMGRASHDAVQVAAAAIGNAPTMHVTLAPVEIVGHREVSLATRAAASRAHG